MHRRDFFTKTAAVLLALRLGSGHTATLPMQSETLTLWPSAALGADGPTGAEHLSAKGALTNIAVPSLRVFKPQRPNGRAVLVAGGGGYKRIEMASEAWPTAQWLVSLGYTAYVLSYRLPAEGWQQGAMAPLQDAQRALRIIRSREQHVQVLGFSAGGHLMGMAATRPDFQSYPAVDHLDHAPAYADRAALIYPVITLEAPYSHTSTHKVLVGAHASQAENARWSVERYVTAHTPPMFLVQAEDDPIADPHNTLIMAAACEAAHVPVQRYLYASGGHGFGMGRPGTPTMQWPERYRQWLMT